MDWTPRAEALLRARELATSPSSDGERASSEDVVKMAEDFYAFLTKG